MQDNGPGVPPHLRDHLFEPFVTTKANGVGLGLALVAKLVAGHGGLIDFESEPGRTVFRVLLPAAPAPSASLVSTHERPSAEDPDRRRRFLDPAGAQPGLQPAGLPGARHRQRHDPAEVGVGRGGRPGDHRRGDAGRERLRRAAAHPQAAPEAAGHRDERPEHAADRGQRRRDRRLRLHPQAVRPRRHDRHRPARAGAARRRRGGAGPGAGDARRAPAADRPLGADAGGLPHHRPPGRRRPDGADPRANPAPARTWSPAPCTTLAAGATASSW